MPFLLISYLFKTTFSLIGKPFENAFITSSQKISASAKPKLIPCPAKGCIV